MKTKKGKTTKMIDIDNEFNTILSESDVKKVLKCSSDDVLSIMQRNDFPSFVVLGKYYTERSEFRIWLKRNRKHIKRIIKKYIKNH